MCDCRWLESIVAIVVFILALWPNLLGAVAAKWVLVIAAVVLFIHAIWCKNCKMSASSRAREPVRKRKK